MNIPKVDHNIPMPPKKRGPQLKPLAKALLELNPGESMLFDAEGAEQRLKRYRTVYTTARRHGVKITARFEDKGVRIWKA